MTAILEHPLLAFHNQFDDVEIQVFCAGEREGPYVVVLTHNDPAIGTADDDQRHELATFELARAKFTELVGNELDAIQSEL